MDQSISRVEKRLFVIISILTLLLGIIIAVYSSQKQQVLKSRASQVSLQIISPKQQQQVLGVIGILAKASSKNKQEGLKGVLVVDDKRQFKLGISKEDGDVTLRTTLNTNNLEPGNHSLKIILYDISFKPPQVVGASTVNISTTRDL